MSDLHRNVLSRIADCNGTVSSGPGFDPHAMVPAFKVHHRIIADRLQRALNEHDISVECQRTRLSTEFFVPAAQLRQALDIHGEFLARNPDTPPRTFSRDYDSVFLLLPITIVATIVLCLTRVYSAIGVLAIWVSGLSAMLVWERVNRQYRVQIGRQLGLRELFIITAIVAANSVLWRSVIIDLTNRF